MKPRGGRDLRLTTSLTLLVLKLMCPLVVNGQATQSQIAEGILSENPIERRNALAAASAIQGDQIGPELRMALLLALERYNQITVERDEASRRGERIDPVEDPEAYLAFMRIVTRLKTPAAIPALIGALNTGLRPAQALAEFGEQSLPSLLRVVTSPEKHSTSQVRNALAACRYMLEDSQRLLSSSALEEVRRITEQHLTVKPQNPTVLSSAIDLAVVLNDENLLRVVKSIASDRNEIVARGIEDLRQIQNLQQRAADGLRGDLSPLPKF